MKSTWSVLALGLVALSACGKGPSSSSSNTQQVRRAWTQRFASCTADRGQCQSQCGPYFKIDAASACGASHQATGWFGPYTVYRDGCYCLDLGGN